MKSIYILLWVHRGFIQEPEFFKNKKDVYLRKAQIQERSYNSDYDEVEIFKKLLPC